MQVHVNDSIARQIVYQLIVAIDASFADGQVHKSFAAKSRTIFGDALNVFLWRAMSELNFAPFDALQKVPGIKFEVYPSQVS